MKLGKKPSHVVVIEGGLNARYFDYFWAFMQIHFMSESELMREAWREKWDKMSEADKNVYKRYLEKNPSPRMEQQNKMKCE